MASDDGGGIFSDTNLAGTQATRITNSTISGNTAADLGGGLFNIDGLTVIAQSTITANTARAGGGSGVANFGDTYTRTQVSGTIIAGNTNEDVDVVSGTFNTFQSSGHNLIGSGGGLVVNGLANFPKRRDQRDWCKSVACALADNGGSTQTHALLPGSPAVGAGDPNFNPNAFTPALTNDQRGAGFARVIDGRIDIGAVESPETGSLIVTTNQDVVNNQDGLTSLREAIAFANRQTGADTITFDASVFATAQAISLSSQLPAITEAVTITGTGASLLTIDGGNGSDGMLGTGDGFRPFNIDDGTAATIDVEIQGLTLSGGDSPVTQPGGAIHSRENLTLTNSILTGNATNNSGGAIHTRAGQLTLNNSQVTNNRTARDGGGIKLLSSVNVMLNGSIISGNSANNGGGIYNSGGTLVVTSSTISGNNVNDDGGGIYSIGGTLIVTSSTISGNNAGDDGGGIDHRGGGNMTVTSSTISGNNADDDGGGIIHNDGNLTVISSTISDNNAIEDGGGISSNTRLNGTQTTRITSSTISGNTSGDRGGGLFNIDGLTVITQSTITANTAPAGLGSGVASFGGTFTLTRVSGTIVAGNTNEDVAVIIRSSDNTFQSDGYNLIGTGGGTLDGLANFQTDTTNVIGASPLLSSLANNGGPTQTHALLPRSPALSAGDPNFDVNGPDGMQGTSDDVPFDQRGSGFDRVRLGRIDIGAVELQTEFPSLIVTTNQDLVNDQDQLTSLREAINFANSEAGADTITFDSSLSGGTITLGGSELLSNGTLTIDASLLAGGITVDAVGNSRVLVQGGGSDNSITLRGLTLTGGSTTGSGGGVYSLNADINLENAIITGNANTGFTNTGKGGGIGTRFGNVTLIDSTVSGNTTSGFTAHGGGIYARAGNVTLTRSVLSDNITSGLGASGGGLYTRFGDVILTDSTISGNRTSGAGANGGGIFAIDGNVTLTGSTVSGNRTSGVDTFGGGIRARHGKVTLTGSTVSGNTTSRNGGGIDARNGDVAITNSTISGNRAVGDHGGGIFSDSGVVTIDNSTITQNSAGSIFGGGGIWLVANGNESLIVRNSIIAGNTDSGIAPDFNAPQNASDLTVKFSLIGSNVGTGLAEAPSGSPDANGNLIGGSTAGVIDPMLGALADNGGPTQTHALQPGSPAINAGSNALLPADVNALDTDGNTTEPIPFEQRGVGFSRMRGGRIDMGAFEVQSAPQVESVVIDNDADVNCTATCQRSMVRKLTVTFDTEVTIDSGAFSLTQTLNGNSRSFAIADADVAMNLANGKTVAVLTFDDSTTGIIGGSLANGNYTLTVDSTKVQATVGNDAMSANHTDDFFRFFGDVDGDRDVDALDFNAFRATFFKSASNVDFNDLFDFDDDDDVDALDFNEFRTRFFKQLAP